MPHSLKSLLRSLAALEVWVVTPLAAACFVSSRFLTLTVMVMVLFWPIRWFAHGQITRTTPADWPVILLVGMGLLAFWVTALPDTTQVYVSRLLVGIGLYYAMINWADSRERLRWLVRGVALVGLVLVGFSFISVTWMSAEKLPFVPYALYSRFSVLVSDTIHPNIMAGSLVILLPVVLGVGLFNSNRVAWYDWAGAYLVVLCMGFDLFLTKSRGAWMALGAVLLLMILLRYRRGWIVVIGAGLGLALLLVFVGPAKVSGFVTANAALNGTSGRVELWSRAIYMVQDFPYTGIGMGTFGPVADTLYPFFTVEPGRILHAHQLWLQIAADLGIPGLVAWLAIWGVVVAVSWQVYRWGRANQDRGAMGLGAGLLCSQVALQVHGLVDSVTWGIVRSAPLVWVLWGLAMVGWYVYPGLSQQEKH